MSASDIKAHAVEAAILKASDHIVAGGMRKTGGANIAAATILSSSDSGNTFRIDQDAAFAITLPAALDMVGCKYRFVITDAGAAAVTIALVAAPSILGGVILNNLAAGAVAGATITFVAGTAVVGDWVEVEGLTSTYVHVTGSSSATGGITVA